jgi:hypothetical protein
MLSGRGCFRFALQSYALFFDLPNIFAIFLMKGRFFSSIGVLRAEINGKSVIFAKNPSTCHNHNLYTDENTSACACCGFGRHAWSHGCS